jgi:L-cystine-binding protein/Diaminopimelate-binding protein
VTISEERKKKYDFSEPYTISGIQALVLKKKAEQLNIKGAQDLAGKKVGVGLGTNYEQWVKQDVPKADVRTYEDDPSKFADLRNGRIDAILIDRLAHWNTPRRPRTPNWLATPSRAWKAAWPCARASLSCWPRSTRPSTSSRPTARWPSCRRNTSVPMSPNDR